jgi:hypothetical protein
MSKIVYTAVLLALAGCANRPAEYAECTVPVKRDAGMGVVTDSCAAWIIGKPTRSQQADFEQRRLAKEHPFWK